MASSKRVGVSDIAKHAGVSIGTVSNYLNYPERVSDTLKEKIGAAIKELGYTPRRAMPASSPTAGSPLVGYVMTDIEHWLFTSIFEGIQDVCEDNDMQVIGLNASSDRKRQGELVRLLISMNVAGILLSTVEDASEDVAAARAANIPIILIDHTSPRGSQTVCSVLENNVSVGELAAEELIRTGCRRIAFAAHSFDYEAIQDRQAGIAKAIARTGGEASFELINSGGLVFEDGYQLGLKLADTFNKLDADERDEFPDGIITGTDVLAAGIIKAFVERGVRVPEDVGVIGTEGTRIEAVCPMPLSVVAAPGVDMGRKAMTQLLDYAEGPATHVHGTTLIEPTLIRRASTRP